MSEKSKQQNVRIIKINNCKSLSGKSSLEYQIGCYEDSTLCIRVVKNSGGGWFSKVWVTLSSLIAALEAGKQPLTSNAFQSFFKDKSVNTTAFLFAAIKEEGLVSPDIDNPRCYALQSVEAFMQTLNTLAASGVSLPDTSISSNKSETQKLYDDIPVISSSTKSPSVKAKKQ